MYLVFKVTDQGLGGRGTLLKICLLKFDLMRCRYEVILFIIYYAFTVVYINKKFLKTQNEI